MRNFNSLFNSTNLLRNTSPFPVAGSSFATRAAATGLLNKAATRKITLSGILNGAQKTIGTVNQIVPLYNQVKPMFQNSKILMGVAKGLKNTSNNARRNRRQSINNQTIDIKPKEETPIKETKKNEGLFPSKPFFV